MVLIRIIARLQHWHMHQAKAASPDARGPLRIVLMISQMITGRKRHMKTLKAVPPVQELAELPILNEVRQIIVLA